MVSAAGDLCSSKTSFWLILCSSFTPGSLEQRARSCAVRRTQSLPEIRVSFAADRVSIAIDWEGDGEMDALSEALSAVRMTGAIFYHAECSAPWGFRVPQLQTVAHVLAPGTERLMSYHISSRRGKATVRFAALTVPVAAGDVLIIRMAMPTPWRTAFPRLSWTAETLARQVSGRRPDDDAAGRRRRADALRLRLFRL